jgi:hypothetical protein
MKINNKIVIVVADGKVTEVYSDQCPCPLVKVIDLDYLEELGCCRSDAQGVAGAASMGLTSLTITGPGDTCP